MQVDPQPPPASSSSFSPTFPSSFEDFFNMDLVSSSRSSSSSPHSPSVNSFPYTPPQQAPLQSFFPSPYDSFSTNMDMTGLGGATSPSDPSEFLNMYLDDDFSKPIMIHPSHHSPSSSSTTPYDFLGAFGTLGSSSAASSSSSSSSPHTTDANGGLDDALSPHQQMMMAGMTTIDPQLVGTPSTGRGMSEFEADDERREEDDDEDNDEDDDSGATTATAAAQVIAPVKVGGKGKGRKGTVASGGINKKSASSSSSAAVLSTSQPAGKENVVSASVTSKDGKVEDRDSEDWRPSPEEYKKMSSKEKRQLRNKISARNFRVRRKEYISTLEADISERDALISAIRTELGSSKSENVALRQEIAALKKALLGGRGVGETPVLPPPAPLPVSPASTSTSVSPPASAATTTVTTTTTSPLITPNTQKDLPTSPRLTARGGFWGGAIPGAGYTPVHTTFVPPMPLVGVGAGLGARLERKTTSSSSVQENINPSLNRVPSPPIVDPSPFAKGANAVANSVNAKKGNALGSVNANGGTSGKVNVTGAAGFDAFMDMNPFTLKTLDAYRMQLWGRMAAQTHQHQQQQQQQQQQLQQQYLYQQQQQSHQLTGLAEKLRPQFFRDAQGFSALSGKAASASSPATTATTTTTTSTPPSAGKDWREKEREMYAAAAAVASQTLLKKLGSAFWDAFSGSQSLPSTSASTSSSSATSASASTSTGGAWKQWDADKVRKVLEGKAVVRVVDVESPTASPASSPRIVAQSSPKIPSASGSSAGSSERRCCVTDILEESMRSLSLGKK